MNAAYAVVESIERTDSMYQDQYGRLFIDDRLIPGDMPESDILDLLDVDSDNIWVIKSVYQGLWELYGEVPTYGDIQEHFLMEIVSIQEEACMEDFGEDIHFWSDEEYRENELAEWIADYMNSWGSKAIDDLRKVLTVLRYVYIYSGSIPMLLEEEEYTLMARSVIENNPQQKLFRFPSEDLLII